MLFGRSRLLLAGIPTGAVLIGILWLKRRRSTQCLHHTDPGGSSKEKEEEEKKIIKDIQIQNNRIPLEVPLVDFKEEGEEGEEEDIYLEEEVFLEAEENSDLTENCLETEGNVERIKSSEISCDFVINTEETQVINDSVVKIEKIDFQDHSTKHLIEEKNIEISEVIDNSTDSTVSNEKEVKIEFQEGVTIKKVIEEVNLEKKIKWLESAKKVEPEKVDTLDICSNTEISTESNNIELLDKVREKEIKEKVEDISTVEEVTKKESKEKLQKTAEGEEEEEVGAVGNMKTAPTTELAEKLASLELDTMKIRDGNSETEQKGCSERDSANHSPSEVMLASPSISNFSDAHSEGSSDSGKGHSDVATSPSRTPAGGSSLAGDHAPSIYEFVLPQVIVGRLIGRRGTFLHEIRSSTQTNIYIKRHPDTDKLKICAIEGSQQDIDKALAKIRQKFPLRRFPQLTLEKVSFVTINPLPPLKLEDFHLQLVEGVNNDVILSSLITAAHFFLQQPSHPSYASLGSLNHVMNQVYSASEAPALDSPIKDAVCAAPTMGGWYRAQIVNIEEETGNSTVRFLDYGGYLTLNSNNLRQIRGDLLALPFQAVECYLANVAPAEESWSEEARIFVHNATVGQILQAQIYDYAEDGTPLVYLYASYGSQVILINEELVMRGYGVLKSIQEE